MSVALSKEKTSTGPSTGRTASAALLMVRNLAITRASAREAPLRMAASMASFTSSSSRASLAPSDSCSLSSFSGSAFSLASPYFTPSAKAFWKAGSSGSASQASAAALRASSSMAGSSSCAGSSSLAVSSSSLASGFSSSAGSSSLAGSGSLSPTGSTKASRASARAPSSSGSSLPAMASTAAFTAPAFSSSSVMSTISPVLGSILWRSRMACARSTSFCSTAGSESLAPRKRLKRFFIIFSRCLMVSSRGLASATTTSEPARPSSTKATWLPRMFDMMKS